MKLVMAQSNLTLMGGAELVLLRIAQKYNPVIYTAEYKKENTFPEFREFDVRTISKGVMSKVLPYGRASQGIDYGLAFYNFVVKEDYDVINAHLAPSHWIRNKNERVLWYCHTPLRDIYDLYEYRMSLRKPYQRPIYRLGGAIVRRMDKGVVKNIEFIFANSRNTSSRIMKYYGRRAEVLNGGVDTGLYSNGGDGKYFLYPSRFSPNKRQEYAIEAFKTFKKKHRGYKLVLCGSLSNDSFYFHYYKKIVMLAAKAGNVEIIPNISEERLLSLYSRATAVLYPPINEDYGLVPIQAMASGKPVIAVNEGGVKETVKNGKTGFLVGSESEMAKRMAEVAASAGLSESMGKEGIKLVKERYTWKGFFERFDKQLKKVSK